MSYDVYPIRQPALVPQPELLVEYHSFLQKAAKPVGPKTVVQLLAVTDISFMRLDVGAIALLGTACVVL